MPFNPDGKEDLAAREAWEREQAEKKNKQNELDQEAKDFEDSLPKAGEKIVDAVNKKYPNNEKNSEAA